MQRKRNRLEIIYTILGIVRQNTNSIRPTPLLRYTNISSQSFSEYYKELLEKGFLREELDRKQRKFVSLTDKGFKFLEKYRVLKGFIEEFEL
ncbi:MAG: winged helix DNA-binding protein [Candidatus Diapherotrites archaeon]|uniref:Winged helix DNA-binding protein n=1 Tax=Candidatus Iainarchaeum sp. TaxID=3101447 RepID=A0A939C6Y4_9ARCH|nr:winged helix DNA-binding protein [Candidatus Diapherotrites archaeon]